MSQVPKCGRTTDIRTDEIALDMVAGRVGVLEPDAVKLIAADEIASAGRTSANEVT